MLLHKLAFVVEPAVWMPYPDKSTGWGISLEHSPSSLVCASVEFSAPSKTFGDSAQLISFPVPCMSLCSLLARQLSCKIQPNPHGGGLACNAVLFSLVCGAVGCVVLST